MSKQKKTSAKTPATTPLKISEAQLTALKNLSEVEISTELNKKTVSALVARGWAKETKKGCKITALGKKTYSSQAAA